MPRVEAVVPQHIKAFLGEVILAHVVNILVVPPRKCDVLQPDAFLVNARPRLIPWIAAVRVVREKILEHDPVRVSAPRRKRIPDHGPLWFSPKAKDFSKIMHQAAEDHPPRLVVRPKLFGRLEQMLEL